MPHGGCQERSRAVPPAHDGRLAEQPVRRHQVGAQVRKEGVARKCSRRARVCNGSCGLCDERAAAPRPTRAAPGLLIAAPTRGEDTFCEIARVCMLFSCVHSTFHSHSQHRTGGACGFVAPRRGEQRRGVAHKPTKPIQSNTNQTNPIQSRAPKDADVCAAARVPQPARAEHIISRHVVCAEVIRARAPCVFRQLPSLLIP